MPDTLRASFAESRYGTAQSRAPIQTCFFQPVPDLS